MALLFSTVFIVSCSKDDDEPQTNNDNPYKGEWAGTYVGDDQGKWEVNIEAAGGITGTAESDFVSGMTFPITGTAQTSGDFTAVAMVLGDSVVFTGKFTGNNAAGTWDNDAQSISGTFSGSKK